MFQLEWPLALLLIPLPALVYFAMPARTEPLELDTFAVKPGGFPKLPTSIVRIASVAGSS